MTESHEQSLQKIFQRMHHMERENDSIRHELRIIRMELSHRTELTDHYFSHIISQKQEISWQSATIYLAVIFLTFAAAIWALGIPTYTRAASDRILAEAEFTRAHIAPAAPLIAPLLPADRQAVPVTHIRDGEQADSDKMQPPLQPQATETGNGFFSDAIRFIFRIVIPIVGALLLIAGGMYASAILLRRLYDKFGENFFRTRSEGLRV